MTTFYNVFSSAKTIIRSAKFIFALIFISGGLAANAQTVTLTTTVDENNGNTANIAALIGTPGGTGISLREAIIAANNEPVGSNITINIPAANHSLSLVGNDNTALLGDLDVNQTVVGSKTINIVGVSAATSIITGMAGERIFDVHSLTPIPAGAVLTFNISNVTLTGGNGTSGAAILAGRAGDVTTITNCIFSSNTGSTNGGAISQSSSLAAHDLTITNCTFTGNTVTTAVGGAVNYAGVGNVTITGCTFTNNTAGTQGGAINISGGGTGPVSTNILQNTFSGNTANGATFGGAAVAVTNAQTINVNYNRILGNNSAGSVATGKKITSSGGTITTFNTDNNWWGVNTGPAAANVDILGSTAANWLQLKASASPSVICTNTTTTVTAGFLSNSANNAILPANLTALVGVPITFTNAVLGTLSSPQPSIQASGTATVTYTSGATTGAGSANAVVDNVPNNDAIARANITIQGLTVNNPGVTTGSQGVFFSQTFTASGGTGPYTFTTVSLLPSGLTLSAAGVLSGTPGVSGTFPIVVTATDVNGCTGTGPTYNLFICGVITVTNPAITTGFVGAPFSQAFTASGGIAPYTFTTGSTVPGLTFSSAGVLSGTPTTPGTYNITVTATDAGGCTGTGLNYALVISVNACPAGVVSQLGTAASNTSTSALGPNTITGFTVPAGLNRLLVVTASDAGATSVTGVTFNGTPMTNQQFVTDGVAVDAIFTLALGSSASPTTGNIVMTSASADKFITATVYQSVNQATPVSGIQTANNITVPSASTLNVTSAVNDMVFDVFDYFHTPTAPNSASFGGGQTPILNQGPLTITTGLGGFGYWSTSSKAGAASVAMTRTTPAGANGGQALIHIALNIKAGATVITVTNPVVTTGTVNTPFSQTFTASGGTGPYTFTTFSALPTGLTLSSGGVLSGTPLQSGSFPITVSATDANGCFGTGATYTLVISCPVVTSNAGPDASVCALTTTLAGNTPAAGTGTWTQVAGPGTSSFTNANSPTSGVTVSVQGAYTFRWSISNPTCPSVTDDVIITFASAPTVANAGPDQTLCGTSATLAANTATSGTGLWSIISGAGGSVTTPASPTSGFTGVAGTTYTLRWTISNAPCTASFDEMNVVFTPNNTITLTSGAGTNAQTVPVNTPITNITYATTGATGATVTGLPAGVNGVWAANVVTISGSPTTTVGSPFTYTVTLTGGCGVVTATGTITVLPCTTPTATCPANISLNNTAGQCSRVVTYTTTITGTPAPTVTYAFSGATTASGSGDGSGSTFNVGVTNVTVTATNACGSNSCSFTVTITDNQPPTVITGTIASCYPTVAAAEAAALAATSATDNCPGVITETASTVGTCSAVVTVTETDANGNSATTTYNTRIDNTAPTVTVGTIAGCYPTVAAAEAAALAATSATDNCPGALVEIASTVGTCSAIITVTTTDGCGNATAVTYNTRIDNTAPTVTVGTIGSCYPTVAAAEAAALAATSATDNCPGALVETASTVGTCSAIITVTTTDGCGNATAVTYNTRIDNTAPTVTVGTIGSCYPDVASAEAAALAATSATDNCPGALVETASTVGTCSAVITVTTTDGCGNATAVTYNTRIDNTPPTLTCPAPVTVSCASAVPVPDINAVTGVTDNCPGAITVTHQGDVISSQTCANRYTITRTYRATDGCGNFTECTQIITVNDQTPPTIICPTPVTVSCSSAVPAPNVNIVFATDNCAGTITKTWRGDVISSQTCANRYIITRTYRATDVCGNFSECTQIITVDDQIPPTLTCPGPVTVNCASAVPAPNIASVTGVSDNCAGVVTITHRGDVISNQTCANRYTITRTYRATDVCGNFTECTQIITVNDQIPPVITCPGPVTVSCASAVPAPNIGSVTATDNCGGVISITHIGDVISNQTCANRYTITRTYRATDVCGNFSQCTQIITVNDQTAPVITCPGNITVTTPLGSCTAVVNFTVTATDNCGTVTVVSVPASGSAFPLGTTTVTSTATDACGMTSTCSFTVTVLDGQLPSITTQPVNRTVCAGTTATFSVTAVTSPNAGGQLNYQWQLWNGSAWGDISGATASTLTLPNVTHSMNTNSYRVRVIGLCTTIISNSASLYVNPLPLVSISTSRAPTLLPTQTVNLTAVVSPGGGTYQWFKNNTAIPGATGNSITGLTVADIGSYTCTYTDLNGCVSTSAPVIVSVQPSDFLFIYPNPNSGIFHVRFFNQINEAVTLTVLDSKGALVYRRKFNTTFQYSQFDVDISHVPSGSYLVQLHNSAGQLVGTKWISVYR